jgi:hypothetical protein
MVGPIPLIAPTAQTADPAATDAPSGDPFAAILAALGDAGLAGAASEAGVVEYSLFAAETAVPAASEGEVSAPDAVVATLVLQSVFTPAAAPAQAPGTPPADNMEAIPTDAVEEAVTGPEVAGGPTAEMAARPVAGPLAAVVASAAIIEASPASVGDNPVPVTAPGVPAAPVEGVTPAERIAPEVPVAPAAASKLVAPADPFPHEPAADVPMHETPIANGPVATPTPADGHETDALGAGSGSETVEQVGTSPVAERTFVPDRSDAGGDQVEVTADDAVEARPRSTAPVIPAAVPAEPDPRSTTEIAAEQAGIDPGTRPEAASAGRSAEPAAGTASSAPRRAEAPSVDAASAPVMGTETQATSAAPETGTARSTEPLRHGAVARLVETVERLKDAPPPRTVVVDLPEMDGLRVRVALEGSAVKLEILSGARSDLSSLLGDASAALTERGFDLSGAPGEERHGGSTEEHFENDATPARARRTNRGGLRL